MAQSEREYHRKYYQQNRDKIIARQKADRKKNPEKYQAREQRKCAKLRLECLVAYGNKCKCCGETRNEFLAIDHINGGGYRHRKSLTVSIFQWLRNNQFPEGFQILCHNCNMAKGFYGYCPHEKEKTLANKYPLQPGDVAPDLSDYNFSTEADRRGGQVTTARPNPMNYHGEYPSTDQSQAEGGRLWKVGQAAKNDFLSAPFNVIRMDGDNTGMPAEVREIDIDAYGDAYDPTAPVRTRNVSSEWRLDSDHDGQVN